MWFLLLEILLLLLAAVLIGAGAMYMFMRNRYEDVTESYSSLLDIAGHGGGAGLTRDDLDSWEAAMTDRLTTMSSEISAVSAAVSGLRNANLQPVEQQVKALVGKVDGLHVPDVDEMTLQMATLTDSITSMSGPDLSPLETRLAKLEAALANLSLPEVDLGPVHSVLARVEQAIAGLSLPETDMEPVHGHLTALESKLGELGDRLDGARRSDIDTVTSGVAALSSTVAAMRMPDLSPLEERLQALQMPDLEPIQERLSALEERLMAARQTDLSAVTATIASMPTPDLQPVQDRLSGVEEAVAGFTVPDPPDLDPLRERLDSMEAHLTGPNQDMDALHSRLVGLEGAIAALDKPQVDLSPLHARLTALEGSVGTVHAEVQGLPALAPIEKRLAGLQEAFLSMPEPDLSPVLNSMVAIDSRLDLGAVENRLTAIEYGLAAVHHQLRSRPVETTVTRTESEVLVRPGATQTVRMETRTPQPIAGRVTRPPRDADPINIARKPGDESNLLQEAAFGPADDLESINGVGPMLCELLQEIGVFYFWQMAEWDATDVAWVDPKLMHFRGRIERDNWVGQAARLMDQPGAAKRPFSEPTPLPTTIDGK